MRETGDRDSYPARLIQKEVLAKGRRALVVYGDVHLERTPPALRPGCQAASTIPCFPGSVVDQLEAATGIKAFTIHTVAATDLRALLPEVAKWPAPRVAIVRGTLLGATSFRAFLPDGPLMIGPDGQPQPEGASLRRPIEEVFDAVLYLGPMSAITYSRIAPELCADAEYVRMRRARIAMGQGGAGAFSCVQ